MINIAIIASSTIIDLLNIRLFLQKLNLFPKLDQEYISYWMFYPFDKKFDEKAINQSITIQSIGKKQLRIYLIEELNKNWGLILNQFLNKQESVNISIYQSQQLGDGSKSFFDWIAQNPKVTVSYYPFQDPNDKAFTLDELELTDEEKWILEVAKYPSIISDSDQQLLFNYAHRYLLTGDAWTCLNINYLLLPHQPTFLINIYKDLCASYKVFGRYYEAEFFAKKRLQISIGKDKVMASYTYLMLLARYHAPYFKDYETAEKILEEAHQYIQSLDSSSEEFLELRQHEIYDPNRRAYIYFKQKKYDEAIRILQEGVDFLDQNLDLKSPVYYSLLVYNLAQTYKRSKNNKKTVATYERLLELDPLEVVYIVDFATYYIDIREFDKAKNLIDNALKIKNNLPIAHTALGYLYLKQEKLDQSELHYKKALEIVPNNVEYLYNYAYILALQEKYKQMMDLLDENQWQDSDRKAWLKSSKSYYIDFLFLYVEGLTYCNQVERALQLLRGVHGRFPDHPLIKENLQLLEIHSSLKQYVS